MNTEDVRKLIYTPDIFEINLEINGETRKAVMKELQFQPVKEPCSTSISLEVYPEKPIVMEVPVQIEGHAEGVKAGGKLSLHAQAQSEGSVYRNPRASRGERRQPRPWQVLLP